MPVKPNNPYFPSTADMAHAAKIMGEAVTAARDDLAEGFPADADQLYRAIMGMSVRQLAYLHHFITVPKREA